MGQVRKGEHGSVILFYKELEPDLFRGEADRPERRYVARASHVFNTQQVEGWKPPEPEFRSEVEVSEKVEAFVRATGADIRHGGDHACYRIKDDYIQMPERARFKGSPTSTPTETYYSTLLHELTHWTGAAHRLSRESAASATNDMQRRSWWRISERRSSAPTSGSPTNRGSTTPPTWRSGCGCSDESHRHCLPLRVRPAQQSPISPSAMKALATNCPRSSGGFFVATQNITPNPSPIVQVHTKVLAHHHTRASLFGPSPPTIEIDCSRPLVGAPRPFTPCQFLVPLSNCRRQFVHTLKIKPLVRNGKHFWKTT